MEFNFEIENDISEVVGIAIRKALVFKGVKNFSDEEINKFINELNNDDEFINACSNITKIIKK